MTSPLSREAENERDLVTREYHMRVTTALVAERDRYREALEEIRERALRQDDAVLYRITCTALDNERGAS